MMPARVRQTALLCTSALSREILGSSCEILGSPDGAVTLNREAGTSHLPGAPIFTLTMLEVMYWIPTFRDVTSGPNCGSVDAALLRLPVCAEPATHMTRQP